MALNLKPPATDITPMAPPSGTSSYVTHETVECGACGYAGEVTVLVDPDRDAHAGLWDCPTCDEVYRLDVPLAGSPDEGD